MLVESGHLVIWTAQNTKSPIHQISGGAIPLKLKFLLFVFLTPKASSAIRRKGAITNALRAAPQRSASKL
jgi:hypothetical protein